MVQCDMTDIYVLGSMTKIIEDRIGIIYSVSPDTRAIVHKIGNCSKVKEVWDTRQEQYKYMEKLLGDLDVRYCFIEFPATTEISELHAVGSLEHFMLKNNIHPLRKERLPFERQAT